MHESVFFRKLYYTYGKSYVNEQIQSLGYHTNDRRGSLRDVCFDTNAERVMMAKEKTYGERDDENSYDNDESLKRKHHSLRVLLFCTFSIKSEL